MTDEELDTELRSTFLRKDVFNTRWSYDWS